MPAGIDAGDFARIAKVKTAWSVASATMTLELQRPDSDPINLDLPLPAKTSSDLLTAFRTKYHVDLEAYQLPSDALLGRLKRECDRKTLTALDVNKIRALNEQPVSAKKTLQIGSDTLDIVDKSDDKTLGMWGYYWRHMAMMNGCAIVGAASGWSTWQTTSRYSNFMIRKATSTPRPDWSKVIEADFATRSKWSDLIRNEGLTLETAMARASVECAHLWLLLPAAPSRPTSSGNATRQHTKPRAGPYSRAGPRLADKDAKGRPICRNFNLPHGCSRKDCTFSHTCNLEGCGRSHSRASAHN